MSKGYSIIRLFSQSIGRAAACLVALFIFTAMAGAATYTVDTSSDNGGLSACTAAANDCSLRGAVSRANASPDPDVITFAGSYTIILTGLEFEINDAATAGALTITNTTGASNLVIDANWIEPGHLARGFKILPGGNLTLNGVTVRNGGAFSTACNGFPPPPGCQSEPDLGGGGILNEGTLLLTNSIVSGNIAIDGIGARDISNLGGGGIFNRLGATMTIEHSTVSGNSSYNGGGGIYNEGTLTLTNSTVSGNSVPDVNPFREAFRSSCVGGGGICNIGTGTLNLTNSTVSNNGSDIGGGGIFNFGINSTANIYNSAIVNNSAGDSPIGQGVGGGGGIANYVGTLNLVNVTVGNNSVGSSGGGIANVSAEDVLLINVTVANNSAGTSGGGIANFDGFTVPTSAYLLNTIVAKNSAPAAPDYEGIVANVSGYNLIGDGTGMTGIVNGSGNNQVGASAATAIDPKLNPLALNGGTTLNFALLSGSPAIDKGLSTLFDGETDQRGLFRPSDNLNIPNAPGGNGSDIGAFEVQIPPSFDLTVTKTHTGNFPQGSTGNTYSITVNNNGPTATVGTVSVVDALPTGLTATAITGTGWTCTPANLKCTRSDALAAGASYPEITLTVDVASNAPASVINNVSVSSSGGDSNPANNTASDPTTIGKPDLTVYKVHNGVFARSSSGNTYTITVANSGDAGAPTIGTVSVVDTLPTGLTATDMTGTGWTCALLPVLKCTRSDALGVGGSYPPITLTVDVASNAPASVINTVSVSGGGDSNPANNTASDTATLDGVFDLTVTKTHPGNFTQGGVGTYTITARNSGSGAYIGVILVIDTLPLGLTLRSLPAGTGWNCAMDDIAKAFSCDRTGLLAAGASYPPITATVVVA
jgi:uncharacterized repeat protein (TIGR01451 family)